MFSNINQVAMIKPSIKKLSQKKLVGISMEMSISNNRTRELWGILMPRRKEIQNPVNEDKISLQVYETSYFDTFNPNRNFTKWALIEVEDFDNIPEGMESFVLEDGLYAVFDHKGANMSIFQYIYGVWIPNSDYELDDRPHFEVLGENYRNNHPDSEEEIWIPIKS